MRIKTWKTIMELSCMFLLIAVALGFSLIVIAIILFLCGAPVKILVYMGGDSFLFALVFAIIREISETVYWRY